MSTIRIGNADDPDGHGSKMVSDALTRELPGFWEFFKARHGKFANYGRPDQGPLGYMPSFEVYEAMAETIPVYVAELRRRMENEH